MINSVTGPAPSKPLVRKGMKKPPKQNVKFLEDSGYIWVVTLAAIEAGDKILEEYQAEKEQ